MATLGGLRESGNTGSRYPAAVNKVTRQISSRRNGAGLTSYAIIKIAAVKRLLMESMALCCVCVYVRIIHSRGAKAQLLTYKHTKPREMFPSPRFYFFGLLQLWAIFRAYT